MSSELSTAGNVICNRESDGTDIIKNDINKMETAKN